MLAINSALSRCLTAGTTADAWDITVGYTQLFLYDTRLYYSGYAAASLDAWADRCRRWAGEERDVFVYFDNSAAGKAPHDALKLMARLADPSG